MSTSRLPLRSGFAFAARYRPFGNMPSACYLRPEVMAPPQRQFAWRNFYFGTDYAGTPTTKSFTESFVPSVPGMSRARSVNV